MATSDAPKVQLLAPVVDTRRGEVVAWFASNGVVTRQILVSLLALVALLAATHTASAADKRPLPDYDGRGGEPTTTGDALLWVPRVALSPLYFVSEFVLRRPIGALIAGAERAGIPATLYDFFAFGPDHKIGIVPTGFVDFGFRPAVGLYAFWDDAIARGNDLRLHLGTWGSDWLSASLSDRIHLSKDPYDRLKLDASASRRPDYAYFGIGPSTRENAITRYGSDRLELQASVDERLWRTSSFHASVAARSVEFHHGELGNDPPLDEVVASGLVPAPPGFPRGYTAVVSSLSAALDSRRPRPASGSGVRVEVEGAHASDVRTNGSWVTYGGSAGAFVDLDDHARVLSFSVTTKFADPIGHGDIPFTELVHLGGFGQMRAFYPGRLVDRSAAVAELAYRWPIWIWLDGSMRMEVGNVFAEHLQDFKPARLRFSGAVGLETVGSPDNSLQILFGVGSETFESGGKIDAFRLVVGTTRGF